MNRRRRVHPLQIRQNSSEARLSESAPSSSDQIINCRVCRGALADPDNKAAPCECASSLHLTCLSGEMAAVLRGELLPDRRVSKYPCAKCKTLIRFESSETLHCRSLQELRRFRKHNPGLCTGLTLGALLILLLLVFLLVLLLQPGLIAAEGSYNSAVIATGIALGVLVVMVGFFCCLSVLIERSAHVRLLPSLAPRKRSTNVQITECS